MHNDGKDEKNHIAGAGDEYPDGCDGFPEKGYEDDCGIDYPDNHDLEYLNSQEEHVDHDELTNERPRISALLRAVALVTMLVFLGVTLAASWPVLQFPLAELAGRSIQLQKDIDTKRLQAAVVQINVVSHRKGLTIAVESKAGTGFNISPEGLIVTNHHVISDALNMTITFPDGKIYRAENWASYPEFDLAIIKLRAKNLPVVPVNASAALSAGDRIRVVGNPLGLDNVVVEGKIDQYVRVMDNPEPVLSIDAPVYPGNSGSPVFDKNGEVVGVVFARYNKKVDGEEKIYGLVVPIKELLDAQSST